MKFSAAAATLILLGTASAAQLMAGEAPEVRVTAVLSATTTATGQPIMLPKSNAELRVSLYDIPVGATLAVHKHPYHRYAYVLAGKLRVVADADSGRTFDYAAGDFVVEVVDTWHHGTNIGSEPVRLLVIDQVDIGQTNTVLER